jgi:hypothetical protein
LLHCFYTVVTLLVVVIALLDMCMANNPGKMLVTLYHISPIDAGNI